ncbi:biopolymer transporter ExbD [Flavipsychrobacter stenotrophus]|uniref:Biopolymer transporter ExbD n=1 Tax=Flavipsychrobacter stenotrophus TaxID=2077091 RepID=A0A2S7T132_9BACT|nr:biopolymer transporter ExbD [Flavipsychrobacter stenotrophus]PQJ12674.1 biopolymer transporter ExbD [Flavipsychrobacter stenotrophus]
MAELDTSSGGGHKKGPGVKKAKKLSTRIDLTPMVDLGFLLITFFMFTTTLAKPKTMEINMPYKDPLMKDEDKNKIKNSVALTILLSKNHRLYYYEGIGDDPNKPPEYKVTGFKQKDGIRDVIINKKKMVDDLKRQQALTAKDEATILIKPDSTSTYSDLVNILDEMTINGVKVYAIIDISPVELENIAATVAANGGK